MKMALSKAASKQTVTLYSLMCKANKQTNIQHNELHTCGAGCGAGCAIGKLNWSWNNGCGCG